MGNTPDTDLTLAHALLAAANAEIDRIHRALDLDSSEFVCECGDPRCKDRITISRAEYDLLVASSQPIVAAHVDDERREQLRVLRSRGHELERALSRGAAKRRNGAGSPAPPRH